MRHPPELSRRQALGLFSGVLIGGGSAAGTIDEITNNVYKRQFTLNTETDDVVRFFFEEEEDIVMELENVEDNRAVMDIRTPDNDYIVNDLEMRKYDSGISHEDLDYLPKFEVTDIGYNGVELTFEEALDGEYSS